MSESEPLMTYRETMNDVETRLCSLTWDKCRGHLDCCLHGIRYLGGMILNQATAWNVGNKSEMLRETLKWEEPMREKVLKFRLVTDWSIVVMKPAKAEGAKGSGQFSQRLEPTCKIGGAHD